MTAPLDNVRSRLARQLLKYLFISTPESNPDQGNHEILEDIYLSLFGQNDLQVVELPDNISAADFLYFLVNKQEFLFHGSNQSNIDMLTPRIQENYRGDEISAVFASSDAIWAMFFAIIDRERYQGSLRNGSFLLSRPGEMSERYYFFSINREMLGNSPWRSGSVYILLRDSFNQSRTGIVRFDEWFSKEPVTPIAKIDISSRDFPLFERVGTHNEGESIYLTWIKYKKRLKQEKMDIVSLRNNFKE